MDWSKRCERLRSSPKRRVTSHDTKPRQLDTPAEPFKVPSRFESLLTALNEEGIRVEEECSRGVRCWHRVLVCAVQGHSGVGVKADLPVERPDFSL